MTTTESENFYRVITLLIDAGTEVMRKLFTSYAFSSGATTVYNYLSNEQAKIFKLQKSKHLKGHQVSLLLGFGSSSGIDINTWDINLLCVLLKNICPVSQQEEAAIENLRVLRNTVHGHASDARLSQSNFTMYWQKIEGEILLLAQACGDTVFEQTMKQTFIKIKTGPLHIESTVEALKSWYAQDQATVNKLEHIDSKLDELLTEVKGLAVQQKKSENPVLDKMKEHTRVVLKEFSLDSFVETSQIVKARKILDKENSIFICGAAGEGKTACAFSLASMFDRDRLVLINNPYQIEQVDPKALDMIVIDDIFGGFNFDQDKFNAWKQYLDVLVSFVKCYSLKVIVTLRTEVWLKCQVEISRLEIFAHMVQLSSTTISTEEKQKILEKHLELNGRTVQPERSKELVDNFHLPFAFPSCANMFATKTESFQLQSDFFILPYSFIRGIFISMDKEYYATLLFLFYKKEKCPESDLKPPKRLKMVETNANVTLLNDIAKLVGISTSKLSLTAIRDNLDILCDFLVKHENKAYCFLNETIYKCIALYHGEKYPEEVIENCTVDFLYHHVQVNGNDMGSFNTLVIEEDSFETLADRIIEEVIENGITYKTISYHVIQSKLFCKFLAETLLETNRLRAFLDANIKGDDAVGPNFLASFIKANTDQICVHVVTQFLHNASKSDNAAWYKDLKSKSQQLLQESGYHETLKSLSSLE